MPKIITHDMFIARCISTHGDKYDYSKVEYSNQGALIDIRCKEHDVWFVQKSELHQKYSGCTKCATKLRSDTTKDRHGVSWAMQSKELLDKYNYSVESKSNEYKQAIKDKTKKTFQDKFGVEYVHQIPGRTDMQKATKLSKYGSETYNNPDKGIATKIKNDTLVSYSKTNKKYTLPSGKKVNIQGYENFALDKLLSDKYTEEDLQLTGKKAIHYFWSSDDGQGDDKWHYYVPDIVIPKENFIIEVKSTYTYDGNGKRIDKYSQNKAKQKACIEQGYKFEFWIVTNDLIMVA